MNMINASSAMITPGVEGCVAHSKQLNTSIQANATSLTHGNVL